MQNGKYTALGDLIPIKDSKHDFWVFWAQKGDKEYWINTKTGKPIGKGYDQVCCIDDIADHWVYWAKSKGKSFWVDAITGKPMDEWGKWDDLCCIQQLKDGRWVFWVKDGTKEFWFNVNDNEKYIDKDCTQKYAE